LATGVISATVGAWLTNDMREMLVEAPGTFRAVYATASIVLVAALTGVHTYVYGALVRVATELPLTMICTSAMDPPFPLLTAVAINVIGVPVGTIVPLATELEMVTEGASKFPLAKA